MPFDAEVIDYWLERYPWRYGKRIPALDRCGRVVRSRSPKFLQLNEFLTFAEWKSGGRARRHLTGEEEVVERVTLEALQCEGDMAIVEELIRLPGVRVRVASALLRFVWPHRFGCVDWKNWYVLSFVRSELGEDNVLFDAPLLPRLSSPYSSVGIGVTRYCAYLQAIRRLAEENPDRTAGGCKHLVVRELAKEFPSRTPAEIDMALYAYSQRFANKL